MGLRAAQRASQPALSFSRNLNLALTPRDSSVMSKQIFGSALQFKFTGNAVPASVAIIPENTHRKWSPLRMLSLAA
jgi:hypothetical protein